APGWVVVTLTGAAGALTIQVQDSGAGVPETLRQRIFSDGFTTKAETGNRNHGLGLALVLRLVRRAGGTITVDSAPATTFTVVLPATITTPAVADAS
ncbi:MAG: ATP-binding protein, partial [Solirubrobacteraceae bacterium]